MSKPEKDSTFDSPEARRNRENFGVLLGQIARLWRAEIDRRLSPHGLTQARWLTLKHLDKLEGPVTQRELAEVVSVQGPTLVRTLDWLEFEGLIERRPLPADRRAKSLHLTEKSAPVLERIQTVAENLRSELLAEIPADELETCLRVFQSIAGKLGGSSPAGRGPTGDAGDDSEE